MERWFELLPTLRIAVVGDVMLDCYVSGEVRRISPEAPVPVLRVSAERAVPGGAANVAANLAQLGIAVDLVGMVGDDAARDDLLRALAPFATVDLRGLVTVPGRRTTRKLRIVGAGQQIARVDHEDVGPVASEVEQALIEAALAAAERADLVVVSDYAKGSCTPAMLRATITRALSRGRRVIVDPKRVDWQFYRGATLLTPNRTELTAATGLPCETDEEAVVAARVAAAASGAEILLTRSDKGLSFFPAQSSPIHMPTVAQAVFDVSGAGDTVLAGVAAALGAGLPMAEAMRIANHAAGVVVSRSGTATISAEELAAVLRAEEAEEGDGRLLSRSEAIALRCRWAAQRLTVGFANGCFDLLHPGHVELVRQAAAGCDRLIMALNSDASVRRLKGKDRPVQHEAARAKVVGALRGVAAVVLFEEDTPSALIEALEPDVLIKGADYVEAQVVGADLVKARGGRVMLVALTPGQSTTALLRGTR